MSRPWPDSQRAWHALAADLAAAQQAEREALAAEDIEDADLYEPLSPEEEEMLF